MKIKQILMLVTLALLASLVHAGELIDESFEVNEDEIIDIEIVNGDITIVGWEKNTFHIVGELNDDAEGFELERSNGITRFEEDVPRDSDSNCFLWFRCGSFDSDSRATLKISAPINSVITFEGINVELKVSNLHGNTEMEIVNGPIVAENLSGIISLGTVNGSIDASNLKGRIELSTVNGKIIDRNSEGSRVNLSAVNGSIQSNTNSSRISASTVSGSVELELADVDNLEASSVSGSLDISLNLNDSARVDLSSVSGRVELKIDPSTSARFELNTAVSGGIENRLTDHEVIRKNKYINSSELRFSLNGGNSDIEISTVSGRITLNPK